MDVCLIPSPFAHATCKTFKIIVVIMSLHLFTHQEKMMFMFFMFPLPVLALVFDELGRGFWLHFGTSKSMFVGDSDFHVL